MKFKGIRLLAFVMVLLATAAAATTIYTWTDADGVVHMTNVPPVEPSEELETIRLKPVPLEAESEIQYVQPETQTSPDPETEVKIVDNHVIVPTELFYENRRVTANLLLDTGSTNITLHNDIARKLMIRQSLKGSIRVAGGDIIEAEAFRLDAVTVGPHTKRNLTAGIIEHRGTDVPFDGLLGMNFLREYKYSIDFDRKVLRWHE